MGSACDSLFLSPHLDDAVLSCALTILQKCRAGEKVSVATICSKAFALPAPFDLYAGRRSEDRKALSLLGVKDVIHLDFQDAPFRNLFYRSFERVIMRRSPADDKHAAALAAKINGLVASLRPETIYLPLAVGTHIDHRHTHELWSQLPAGTGIVFYEDRPYSLLPYNLQVRLLQLGVGVSDKDLAATMGGELLEGVEVGRALGMAQFGDGLNHNAMYKNVLTSNTQRAHYFASAAEIVSTTSTSPSADKILEAHVVKTDLPDDLATIKAAVGSYQSQLSMLFKDMETFARESASYNSTIDATALYCERYWTGLP